MRRQKKFWRRAKISSTLCATKFPSQRDIGIQMHVAPTHIRCNGQEAITRRIAGTERHVSLTVKLCFTPLLGSGYLYESHTRRISSRKSARYAILRH